MSRRDVILNPFEDDRDNRQSDSKRSRRSKRPRRRRWPWFVLALLLLTFFLPNLLGLTGMHQRAINYALSDFNGSVSVEKASLGWFQTIKLTNIAAVDAGGIELFKIDSVTSEKSLISMLKFKDLGQIQIQSPTMYVQLRPDGSNVEDAIANYLTPSSDEFPNADDLNAAEPMVLPRATINVIDGRALVSSSTDTQSWQIDNLNAVLQTQSEAAPLVLESACQLTAMRIDENGQVVLQNPGRLMINSAVDPGSTVLQMGSIDVAMAAEALPVSFAAPILQRFIGPAQSAGQFTGKLQSKIDIGAQAMNVELVNVNVNGLAVAAPELLGSDQFRLESLVANGTLELSPQTISANDLKIESDFGKVNANGRFEVQQLTQMAAGGDFVNTPFQMDGEIDLAGLVRMLPSTLQLHKDLTVDSGVIKFQGGTRNEDGAPKLVMNLDAMNLKARRGSQNIVWQKPLRLVGTIGQTPTGLNLENLICESDFLTISGNANTQTGAFRATGDLAILMQRLEQFADLSGMQLAGEIDGTFGWQTTDQPGTATPASLIERPIQIGGSFDILNPVIQFPEMPVWNQPKLSIKLSASGQSNAGQPEAPQVLRLSQGGVQIDVGTERAIATLAQPLQDAFTDPWLLNCQMVGDLNGWVSHIQNFVDLGDIQAAGQIDVSCSAAMNNNLLQLNDVRYAVEQFGFDGYGMTIRDPQVTGDAKAIYDLESGRLLINQMTLSSNSIAAEGQNLTVAFTDNMLIDGAIAFRGDVNRMADWYGLSPESDSVFWFGSAEGTVQLASNEQGIGAKVDSTITDLVAAQRASAVAPKEASVTPVANQIQWRELFREPQTKVDSELIMSHDYNAIQFNDLVVQSSALSVKAKGTIAELSDSMITNLEGAWNPDWQKINALLGAYSGNLVQLAGSGEQPFVVAGPLFTPSNSAIASTNNGQPNPWISPQLVAKTSVRWDQGSILNVPIGASQIDIDLNNSIGSLKTQGIPFSGGVVRFAPAVDMRGENPMLVMEQTRIVDNLQLTPETARQWLKYVAPLVADATSAQGNVTVDVRSVKMPLFDPMAVDARGAVRLNNVVIGAGPLADQLIGTVKQVRSILKPTANNDRDLKTWLKMSEQTIPIQVRDGRVHHENVTLNHKEGTIKTRGSVGFDQTLKMVAEIPIEDDWIGGSPYLAGLKGQSLSIPIGGTVSKPELDRRALQSLSQELTKKAAGAAINQVIGDKLTPKVNEFQNEVNDKIGNELNKFQNKFQGTLNEKLGEGLGGALFGSGGQSSGSGQPNQPAQPGQPQQPGQQPQVPTQQQPGQQPQPNVRDQLEGELMKGIGNLFGGGNK